MSVFFWGGKRVTLYTHLTHFRRRYIIVDNGHRFPDANENRIQHGLDTHVAVIGVKTPPVTRDDDARIIAAPAAEYRLR